MFLQKSNFFKVLSKEISDHIPLYCTGYPDLAFINKYTEHFNLNLNKKNLVLCDKNYSIIDQIGFDAISLWDFRRGKGGYNLGDQRRVDGWGRIYKGDWYTWEGVFRNEKILENWEHLKLPSKKKLKDLKTFLGKINHQLEYVLSLPGLFEKTWQSMGFTYFSKCLKKNVKLVETIISFFSDYVKELISVLQNTGSKIFIIADDYGYKNRTFISKEIWRDLLFNQYQEIINIVHEKNQKIIIHSDGYISDLIEVFIDLDFDAVQSLEANAGVNIFSLFKEFKNQICFIGNLDIALLIYGTPFQVKQSVIKLIKKSKEYNCPLIISPTQQINSKCKPDNIKAMIETTKNFYS